MTDIFRVKGNISLNDVVIASDGENLTLPSNTSITSAETLSTPRKINGTFFNGSENIVTENWGTSRAITLGNTTKNVNGSSSVTWTLSEIGAQATLQSGTNIKTINNQSLLGSGNITVSGDLTGYATETFVNTSISNLVNSAPTTLNTLNELAAALGNDPNFATTITTTIGEKAPLNSPTFIGTSTFVGASIPFGLENFTNTNTKTIGQTEGMFWKSDGTRFYTHSGNSKTLVEWICSIPWSPSSATLGFVLDYSNLIASQYSFSDHIYFKPDGTKMYFISSLSYAQHKLASLNFSVGWDISSIVTFTEGADDLGIIPPNGFTVHPDGTNVYISYDGSTYQYSLGTSWDLDSINLTIVASFEQRNFLPGGYGGGIAFNSTGTQIYYVNTYGGMYSFTLGTAYDISSINFSSLSSFELNTISDFTYAGTGSVQWRPDGTQMFVCGQDYFSNFYVWRYDIAPGAGIISTSVINTTELTTTNLTTNNINVNGTINNVKIYNSDTNIGIGGAVFANGNPNVSNIAIGLGSMENTNNGFQNIAIGPFVMPNVSGEKNIAIGAGSGSEITSGSNNVIIGGWNGNTEGMLDIRTANNYIALSDGAGNLRFYIDNNGTATLQQTTEVLNTKTGSTGTVTHDFSTGSIWYHSSINANFTANFINIPTTDNRTIVCTLILAQGAIAYVPTAVQIAYSAQTVKWLNGSIPTGNANKVDIVIFTLIQTGSAWTVLGSLTTYG